MFRIQDTILPLKQKELDMSQSNIQQRSSDSTQELGDETFMSATELRNYMVETVMAKASKAAGSSSQGLPGDIGFFLTWGDAKR